MNGSFSGHTATLMADGKVLIAGGGSAALYDPNKGTWRATGQMIEDRSYHTATLLPDGRVLVAGGILMAGDEPEDDDLLASAELFDPATGTWSAVPRHGPRARLPPGGAAAQWQRVGHRRLGER